MKAIPRMYIWTVQFVGVRSSSKLMRPTTRDVGKSSDGQGKGKGFRRSSGSCRTNNMRYEPHAQFLIKRHCHIGGIPISSKPRGPHYASTTPSRSPEILDKDCGKYSPPSVTRLLLRLSISVTY